MRSFFVSKSGSSQFERFWLPPAETLKFLYEAQFHLSYRAKLMSWFEVEQLTLPELDWILNEIKNENDRENQKGQNKEGHDLQSMAKQFELVRKLRKDGKLPPPKELSPTQKKRREKLDMIRNRHALAVKPETPRE